MENEKGSNVAKLSLPRFSIWHILLWSAICAILLNAAVREPQAQDPFGAPLPVNSSGVGFRILSAFCESGTICVSIVLLATLANRVKPEPGHWLAIASLVAAYTYSSGYPYSINKAAEMPKLIFILAFTCCGVHLCGWPWYWRMAIFLIGVNVTITNFYFTITSYFPFTAVQGTGWNNPLLHGINLSVEWLVVLLTLFSVAYDLYRKRYRDWLHWVGLLFCILRWATRVHDFLLSGTPNPAGEDPFLDPFAPDPFQ